MKELTVAAEIDNLNEVISFVEEALEELNCSMKIIVQMDVAVEEIYVNIAHYAYPDKKGEARIEVGTRDGLFYVSFSDAGVPYDPLKKPDPDVTLDVEDRPIGGLGIYMVKKSMDRVEYRYEDGHNIFTMYKDISGE